MRAGAAAIVATLLILAVAGCADEKRPDPDPGSETGLLEPQTTSNDPLTIGEACGLYRAGDAASDEVLEAIANRLDTPTAAAWFAELAEALRTRDRARRADASSETLQEINRAIREERASLSEGCAR